MKERPILFSAPMVRAILNGAKTQTRRVVKPQPPVSSEHWEISVDDGFAQFLVTTDDNPDYQNPIHQSTVRSPYGKPGERLWVRENFCPIYPQDPHYNGGRPIEYDYAATYKHGDRLGDMLGLKKRWTPSIHMPRAGSRITLEISRVRVERLNEISEADAIAEGIGSITVSDGGDSRWLNYSQPDSKGNAFGDARRSYCSLWESINGPDSWAANPWVWVIEFKQLKGGAA